MNEEEKKAVEFVKKRTKELKKYAKRENELVYDDIILNLINKLQKENEELKNNKSIVEKILHKGNGFTLQQTQYIWEHYIPVQKVKDKISERQFELQQEYKDFEDDAILIVLQELLEGRK